MLTKLDLTLDLMLKPFLRLSLPLTIKEFALIFSAQPSAALPITSQILADAQAAAILKSAANQLRESLLTLLARKRKLRKWLTTTRRS